MAKVKIKTEQATVPAMQTPKTNRRKKWRETVVAGHAKLCHLY